MERGISYHAQPEHRNILQTIRHETTEFIVFLKLCATYTTGAAECIVLSIRDLRSDAVWVDGDYVEMEELPTFAG